MKELSVFPTGEKNTAYAKYFIGQSYLIRFRPNRSIFPTSPLNRAAATTGTSTPPRRAADRSSSAPQAKDGTRNGASRQED